MKQYDIIPDSNAFTNCAKCGEIIPYRKTFCEACLTKTDEELASRFEIKSCRGKKFTNHEEESDEIDSISDSPAIAELFHFFHNCDKYDAHTPSS